MKRLLTPEFVNEVSPPEKGERWIADTKVRNFGLRLWATKSGGSKAYCVRIGASKRKTFDLTVMPPFSFLNREISIIEGELGAHLHQARNWAVAEIEKMKEISEEAFHLRMEDYENREYFRTYVNEMTLEQAVMSSIKGRKKLGYAEAYTDQVDDLFNKWNACELKQAPLSKVFPDQLAKALVAENLSWANIRVLRSFLGQVYERAFEFDCVDGTFNEVLSTHLRTELKQNCQVKSPELIEVDQSIYEKLFAKLESNSRQWQQAMCIRLFFEFGAPLSRLMSARWSEIHEDFWYPYAPNERSLWFEAREPVSETAKIILDKLGANVRTDFGESDYWFPSQNSKSVHHITTVSRLWKRTAKDIGFEGIPLRVFAKTKRNSTNLSYLGHFLRVYKILLEDEKMAVLSKMAQG